MEFMFHGMLRVLTFWIGLLCLCLWALPLFAASRSEGRPSVHPTVLQDRARELHLDQEIRWQRILYMAPSLRAELRGFGTRISQSLMSWGSSSVDADGGELPHGSQGLVDDPRFYLSPDGQRDPRAELQATIAAFFEPPLAQDPDSHALCRFPARRAFLEERLGLSPEQWPRVVCPGYEAWIKDRSYGAMSLVFSAYFPDSPASMFGHLFIRLHRRKGRNLQSDLLDDVINFSAFADNDHFLMFYLKGIFGGFPGKFGLLPYYLKIQEYNNFESRDLWEYPIHARAEQVDRIVKSLWEIGPHYSWYYYFDRNCAYVLLRLLETGDDSWDFATPWQFWTTPTGSLQNVSHAKILGPPMRRLSVMSRYFRHYDRLHAGEQKALGELLSHQDVGRLVPTLSPAGKQRVVDTALEWIDFKEKLAGSRRPERFASLRNDLLQLRTLLPPGGAPPAASASEEDPVQGHAPSFVMLGASRRFGKSHGFMRWQPVLHDLLSRDEGYARGMQIQMGAMEVAWNHVPARVHLSQVDLLHIVSLHPRQRALDPASWFLRWGWERQTLCHGYQAVCPTGAFNVGRGVGWEWDGGGVFGSQSWMRTALMLQGGLGGHAVKSKEVYGEWGAQGLASASWGPRLKLLGKGDMVRRFYQRETQVRFAAEAAASWEATATLSVRAGMRWEQQGFGRHTKTGQAPDTHQNTTRERSWAGGLLYFF